MGVILFELLTGRRHSQARPGEVAHAGYRDHRRALRDRPPSRQWAESWHGVR